MARSSFWSQTTTLLLVVIAALTLSVTRQSGAVVQAGVLEQIPASTDATTHVLSYQGRLADPATDAPKVDGSYSMTFRIYDDAAAGTILWTEIKDVPVSKGLFSTLLGDTAALAPTIFDGSDRWLGVKVGGDTEATPRMRMAFAPYASWAINAGALNGHPSAFYRNADNIDAGTLADGNIAASITRDGEVMGIVTGADGAGSGVDADLLDGQDSASFAVASHNHDVSYLKRTGPDSMIGSSPGPVLKVTQSGTGDAISAQGSISADRLKYNTNRTHYLSMPAEAFQPGSDVAYFNTYGVGGGYISSGSGALVAPVYLPDGATITRLTVYFNDSSTSDMTVNLNRLSFTAGSYSVLAQVVSSGTSGYQNGSDTSIVGGTINNVGGGYLMYAYSTAWDSSLRLMGVLITYTISEAP